MEILTTIFGLFGGAASGGLIGAIGGFISKYIEHKQKKAQDELALEMLKVQTAHELAMADKSNETLKIEIESKLQQAGLEATSIYDQASFAALKTSYENDKASFATGAKASDSSWFILVDVCRGLTRPLLTWVLCGAVFTITGYLLFILREQLPILAKDKGVDLLIYIVHAVIFLASTSVTYWFASRTVSDTKK